MFPFAWMFASVVLQTAPAPAPVVIEPILFYDSGSVTHLPLNDRNLEAIQQFARRPDVKRITIDAYTDTVGSDEQNLALSERRGRAVAGLLIADGVPASIIEVRPRGEANQAYPTGDNVDQALNRRVIVGWYY